MQIRVLFFGTLKDLTGRTCESLSLPENATLGDVLRHYEQAVPRLKEFTPSLAMSVNQEYAGTDMRLRQGDEVALLPPVSGGLGEGPSNTATNAEPSSSLGEDPQDGGSGRGKHAIIVRDTIDTASVLRGIKQPEDGAIVVFEGIVRDQTRGRRTLYLDYEAYEEMALKQMDELASRALAEFKIRNVSLVHRLGRLEIG